MGLTAILPHAGTITLTNGSTTITGTDGVDFRLYNLGYRLTVPGKGSVMLAEKPTLAEEAEITTAWQGTTVTNAPYDVTPTDESALMAERFRQLIELLGGDNVQGLAGLDLGTNNLLRVDDLGDLATTSLTALGQSIVGIANENAAQNIVGKYETRTIAAAATIPALIKTIDVLGFSTSGVGGAIYTRVTSEPSHGGKFRSTDRFLPNGSTDNTNGGWWEIASEVLRPEMFGLTGQADDYAVFQLFAGATRALNRTGELRRGSTYTLNGGGVIEFKTDLIACGAVIKIPKNNGACRLAFVRDDPTGTVLDTSDWGTLDRDATAIGATSAFGKNLRFISTEVLIERGSDPSVYSPYTKQEMQRCRIATGELATALVHSYTDKSKLTVTAFTPCTPIRVVGLTIVRTGTSAAVNLQPSVHNYRDNLIFDDLDISTEDTASGAQGQGLVLVQCCDVTLNRPHIRGCNYDGTGYGVQAATTINVVYNNPRIYDCREAIAGRHNVDQTVNGGICAPMIDDHWGDRMVINDTVIKSVPGSTGVLYAGNDITLNNVTMFNGRQLLAIRVDTPHLGGSVIINNPRVVSMNEDPAHGFFLVALSTPVGVTYTGSWTIDPKLPDHILLNGGDIRVNTNSGLRYLVYLGSLYNRPHLNWGQVTITGTWNLNVSFTGVYYIKNTPDQETRQTQISIDGPIDFKGGDAVHCTVADDNSTRPALVYVNGPRNMALRMHPLSFQHLEVENARVTSYVSLNTSASHAGSSHYRTCRFDGGAFANTLRNAAFTGCAFMGAYSDFPSISYATMIANYKNSAATGLPADIRDNVVSPYS